MDDVTILIEVNNKLTEVKIPSESLNEVQKAIKTKITEISLNRGFYERLVEHLPGMESISKAIGEALSGKER